MLEIPDQAGSPAEHTTFYEKIREYEDLLNGSHDPERFVEVADEATFELDKTCGFNDKVVVYRGIGRCITSTSHDGPVLIDLPDNNFAPAFGVFRGVEFDHHPESARTKAYLRVEPLETVEEDSLEGVHYYLLDPLKSILTETEQQDPLEKITAADARLYKQFLQAIDGYREMIYSKTFKRSTTFTQERMVDAHISRARNGMTLENRLMSIGAGECIIPGTRKPVTVHGSFEISGICITLDSMSNLLPDSSIPANKNHLAVALEADERTLEFFDMSCRANIVIVPISLRDNKCTFRIQ